MSRVEWSDFASCKGLPSNTYFPVPSERPSAAALALCAECPVQAQCFDAGRHERFGWWGGYPTEVQWKVGQKRRESVAS